MTVDGWLFSAHLAWGRMWIRLATVFALVVSLGVSAWFLASVVPEARTNGTFAYHYSIYLGIDDVRSWGWAFALPAVWIVFTAFDLLLAFGLYRTDAVIASTLIALTVLWALPWAGSLFYLALANTTSV